LSPGVRTVRGMTDRHFDRRVRLLTAGPHGPRPSASRRSRHRARTGPSRLASLHGRQRGRSGPWPDAVRATSAGRTTAPRTEGNEGPGASSARRQARCAGRARGGRARARPGRARARTRSGPGRSTGGRKDPAGRIGPGVPRRVTGDTGEWRVPGVGRGPAINPHHRRTAPRPWVCAALSAKRGSDTRGAGNRATSHRAPQGPVATGPGSLEGQSTPG
jgi:hypothetical protein